MSKYVSAIAVGICLLLVGLAPGTLPTVHAAQFEIRLGHSDPPDIYTSRKAAGSTVFKNMVENETGGAVKVNLFPAGQLGGEREVAEAVKLGSVQMGMLSGPFSRFCKEAQVFDIPYLFPSLLVAYRTLDGPFGKELAEECLKKTGMRILTYAQVGFRNFTNSARVIKSPCGCQGAEVPGDGEPGLHEPRAVHGGRADADPLAGDLHRTPAEGRGRAGEPDLRDQVRQAV